MFYIRLCQQNNLFFRYFLPLQTESDTKFKFLAENVYALMYGRVQF